MIEALLGVGVLGSVGAAGYLYTRVASLEAELADLSRSLPSRRAQLGAPLSATPIVGLDPAKIMHPWDIKATQALKSIPLLDKAIKKIHDLGYEDYCRAENIANMLRAGPSMYPRVHKAAETARAVLGLPPIDIWIAPSRETNAFTTGINKPWIVLNSGLIDILDDHELVFVLGHEMGHIICEHVLYSFVGAQLAGLTEVATDLSPFGIAGSAMTGLQPAISEWKRQAELSADRVALLTVRDINIALRVMITLAGGGANGKQECDSSALLRQAGEYNQAKGLPGWLFRIVSAYDNDHPWPVVRAEHLVQWHSSKEYEALTFETAR